VKRFQGGIVFKAHRLVYPSTLGLRVIENKKKFRGGGFLGNLALGAFGVFDSGLFGRGQHLPNEAVLFSRKTASQKCEAVRRRARI